ncbi:MAG: hypothetical protein EPN93_07315 [Spirochaetes bacterium]|nr:MAG: hypothetical protein EPN93_07315 [Spirochaetota bacterium]
MQISCSHCQARYSLSDDEIAGLTRSVFVCASCKTYIKITLCPHCNSSYSISFRASKDERYRLRCRRCENFFMVDFPAIQDPMEAGPRPVVPAAHVRTAPAVAPARAEYRNGPPVLPDTIEARPRQAIPATAAVRAAAPAAPAFSERRAAEPAIQAPPVIMRERPSPLPVREVRPRVVTPEPGLAQNKVVFKGLTFRDFSLKELAAVALSALTRVKLVTAASGIFVSVMLLLAANRLGLSTLTAGSSAPEIVRLALYFAPAMLLFLIYIFTASLIARATLDHVFTGADGGAPRMLSFAAGSLPQVCVNSALLLLLGNTVILLIGNIPLVGPVAYSLLFIPAYLISIMLIIVLVVGAWFYPPIIAYREPGIFKNTLHLYHFIRRHNLGLIPAALTLFTVTGFLCGIAYLLHWGAFSLTLKLSRVLLPSDTGRIFASVPGAFMKISDLLQGSPDRGVFVSVIEDLLFSHHVGGALLGIALVAISLTLFSAALSFTATLSTHVYLMMERDLDLDDRKKIRMLLVIVLLLAGALLVKKLLW